MGADLVAAPSAPSDRAGGGRLERVAAAALVLTVLAYAVTTVPGVRRHAGYQPLLDDGLHNVGYLLAVTVCLLRGRRRQRDLLAWRLLALGMASYGLAWPIWMSSIRPMHDPPYPSAADFLWLGFYPFAFAALMLLVRSRTRGVPLSFWLDGLVGGLGAAAVSAAFVLPAVAQATGGDDAAVATNLAYPTADLLLLGFTCAVIVVLRLRVPPALWLLSAAFALQVVGDTRFLYAQSAGTFQTGTWPNAAWLVAFTLMALAAGHRDDNAVGHNGNGWPLLTVPVLASLTALTLLVLAPSQHFSAAVSALAAAAVLAAIGRMALSFREARQLPETLRQARTDELTGMANRRAFLDDVAAVLRRNGSRHAVLLLDLDRFKEVNDTLGHPVGDRLLAELGPRLAHQLRPVDLLARVGGDEFAVMLVDGDAASAAEVSRRLLDAIREPFLIDGVTLDVDASVGIALHPDHGHEINELLRQADVAMYTAKSAGTGSQLYSPAGDERNRADLRTIGELRVAIAEGQLVLHYQPKIDLLDGRTIGVEALVRWGHPSRGLLMPGDFLPLVERAGLMRQLTVRVLRDALLQAALWRDAGVGQPALPIAVNLSAASVSDRGLPGLIGSMLTEHGVGPELLQLEITEDFLMTDRESARGVLADLQTLGVRLAIDDYGAGYSSLSYLRDLPVDELKLDRAFIRPMSEDPRAAAIVRSTIELAHSLGLSMVAEGVETEGAWRALAGFGCDAAQGYFFSRPLPAADLVTWLEGRSQSAVHRDPGYEERVAHSEQRQVR